MTRIAKLPPWFKVTFTAFVMLVILRYLIAVDSGVGHVVAARTYVFWALVCAPVAALTDIVVRSVMNYRFVQLALARVTNSPTRTER